MACVISEFKVKIAVECAVGKLSVVFTLAQVDVKISQKLLPMRVVCVLFRISM